MKTKRISGDIDARKSLEIEIDDDEYEPSREDLEALKLHCRYWMRQFGLNNYSIQVAIDPSLDHVGAYTQMNHNEAQMGIGLGLINRVYNVGYLARHEMLEVLLEPMYETMSEYVNDRIAQRRGHEVIFRLEKILSIPTDEEVGIVAKKKKAKKPAAQQQVAQAGGKKGGKKSGKKGK